jgi:tetratricopeptide (TPR) repeat protein
VHDYQSALQCFDALGVVFDKIGILNNLGGIALARDDEEQARRFYEEGLALARDLGGQHEIRDLLINLGVVALRQERLDDAERYYAEALALTREIHDRGGIWDLRRRQVRLYLLRGIHWLRKRLMTTEEKSDG